MWETPGLLEVAAVSNLALAAKTSVCEWLWWSMHILMTTRRHIGESKKMPLPPSQSILLSPPPQLHPIPHVLT